MTTPDDGPAGRPRPVPDLMLIIEGLQSQLDDLATAVETQSELLAAQARRLGELERRLNGDPD